LAIRAGLGMAQGVAFPAIHALLAKGVPARRRSGAIGSILALAHCGTALSFGLSPALIDAAGWEASFYAFAAAAGMWAVPWWRMHRDLKASVCAAMAAGGPQAAAQQQAPRHADLVESAHLHNQQQHHQQQQHQQHHHHHHQQQQQQQQATASASASPAAAPKVGFWPLMKRKEVWAIAVAQYCASYGFFGLLAWLPSFFVEHCGLQLSEVRPPGWLAGWMDGWPGAFPLALLHSSSLRFAPLHRTPHP